MDALVHLSEYTRILIREDLEEYLFNESHKVNRSAALFILRYFRKTNALVSQAEMKQKEAEAIIL